MTLATTLYVTSPVDIDALWAIGRQTIIENNEPGAPADPTWDETAAYRSAEVTNRGHIMGQGCCSMYDLYFRKDGAPISDGVVEHDEWCETPCESVHADQMLHYARLQFDTTYAYRDSQGRDCSMLHVDFIITIGSWLIDQGVSFSWENEYTGEIFAGLTGLATMVRSGAAAGDWFRSVVIPAIAKGIAGS